MANEWKDWEVGLLRNLYPEYGANISELKEAGRTVAAIHTKANQLGIHKTTNKEKILDYLKNANEPENISEIADGVGIYGSTASNRVQKLEEEDKVIVERDGRSKMVRVNRDEVELETGDNNNLAYGALLALVFIILVIVFTLI